MPRPKNPVPIYSFHKPTGQAYIRVPDGKAGRTTVYLGPYDSPESREKYAMTIAGLAANSVPTPRPETPTTCKEETTTVNDVLLAFWMHAEQHYRRADGSQTNELSQYRQTFRPVKELFGHTLASQFGPKALKAVRRKMIEIGWTRKLINQRVGRVRRAFKWAASEELVSASVYQGLAAVGGLQAGRTEARETSPIEPVAEEHVRATLPFLRPAVRAMVEVQLLTGMRPGEVCVLRPCDLDTTGTVWRFRPVQYKTRHRNKARVVAMGPRAQTIVATFTPASLTDFYFSPRLVVTQLHAERSAKRKTPRFRSHMARNAAKRVECSTRLPAVKYSVTAYGQAVRRAVKRANDRREELAGPGNFDPVPHWHPNQLRHTHGTAVRGRYGLEAAQVVLGHERADVTQVYAEKNLALAAKVASEIG